MRFRVPPTAISALSGLCAGACYPLAFAPVEVPVAGVVSLAVLCSFSRLRWPLALIGAAAWGFAAFGIGTYWLYHAIQFGGMSAPKALFASLFVVGVQASFATAAILVLRLTLASQQARFIAFAPMWIVFEYLRSAFPHAFPWLLTGYAFVDSPFAWAAPVGGVWAVGLLAAALSSLVAYCHWRKRALAWCLVAAVVLCVPFQRFVSSEDATMEPQDRVALVQARVERERKWEANALPEVLQQYKRWSEEAERQGATVMVWPEVAIPAPVHRVGGFLQHRDTAAAGRGMALLAGVLIGNAEGTYANSMIGLGVAGGRVDKAKLTPLGESIPPILAWFGGTTPSLYPLKSGDDHSPLRIGAHAQAAVAICYEIADPGLMLKRVRALQGRPGYLVVASDESWFRATWEPAQHLQMARMRALEVGLPVLRSANGAAAAVIGTSGQVLATGSEHSDGILIADATPAVAGTLWVRWGEAPMLLGLLLILATVWWLQFHRRALPTGIQAPGMPVAMMYSAKSLNPRE